MEPDAEPNSPQMACKAAASEDAHEGDAPRLAVQAAMTLATSGHHDGGTVAAVIVQLRANASDSAASCSDETAGGEGDDLGGAEGDDLGGAEGDEPERPNPRPTARANKLTYAAAATRTLTRAALVFAAACSAPAAVVSGSAIVACVGEEERAQRLAHHTYTSKSHRFESE
jgi:hypothetical protein